MCIFHSSASYDTDATVEPSRHAIASPRAVAKALHRVMESERKGVRLPLPRRLDPIRSLFSKLASGRASSTKRSDTPGMSRSESSSEIQVRWANPLETLPTAAVLVSRAISNIEKLAKRTKEMRTSQAPAIPRRSSKESVTSDDLRSVITSATPVEPRRPITPSMARSVAFKPSSAGISQRRPYTPTHIPERSQTPANMSSGKVHTPRRNGPCTPTWNLPDGSLTPTSSSKAISPFLFAFTTPSEWRNASATEQRDDLADRFKPERLALDGPMPEAPDLMQHPAFRAGPPDPPRPDSRASSHSGEVEFCLVRRSASFRAGEATRPEGRFSLADLAPSSTPQSAFRETKYDCRGACRRSASFRPATKTRYDEADPLPDTKADIGYPDTDSGGEEENWHGDGCKRKLTVRNGEAVYSSDSLVPRVPSEGADTEVEKAQSEEGSGQSATPGLSFSIISAADDEEAEEPVSPAETFLTPGVEDDDKVEDEADEMGELITPATVPLLVWANSQCRAWIASVLIIHGARIYNPKKAYKTARHWRGIGTDLYSYDLAFWDRWLGKEGHHIFALLVNFHGEALLTHGGERDQLFAGGEIGEGLKWKRAGETGNEDSYRVFRAPRARIHKMKVNEGENEEGKDGELTEGFKHDEYMEYESPVH